MTNVLIVESTFALAQLWCRHLERQGAHVTVAVSADEAVDMIAAVRFDVIVLDLVLSDGSALAVSDFAEYRQPGTNVIFVTDTTFFSDGSIFNIAMNARALLQKNAKPEDLAAMVEHYGAA